MNKDEVFNVIVTNTCEVVPEIAEHKFSLEDSLRDLGANSVDRSEIIMMSLEALQVDISMIHFARAQNIGELASIICDRA